MIVSTYTQTLLNRVRELLPLSEDEIVQRGITEAATARIIELRRRVSQLTATYGGLEGLEQQIRTEGVPVNDHTRYTDLLEWRSVHYELAQLTGFLEDI